MQSRVLVGVGILLTATFLNVQASPASASYLAVTVVNNHPQSKTLVVFYNNQFVQEGSSGAKATVIADTLQDAKLNYAEGAHLNLALSDPGVGWHNSYNIYLVMGVPDNSIAGGWKQCWVTLEGNNADDFGTLLSSAPMSGGNNALCSQVSQSASRSGNTYSLTLNYNQKSGDQ